METTITVVQEALPFLAKGALITVELTVVSLIFASIIGLVTGFMRMSDITPLRWIAAIYINIIRGTPLLVQILYIYFGIPFVLKIKLSSMAAGIITMSLYAGAYLAEIFRAGIESIDKGQREGGMSLGFSYWQTMRKIILPQAFRRMIPTFVNQITMMIKDTSLLSTIGVAELTFQGQSIYAANFETFRILTTVGVFYFIMVYALTKISVRLEKRQKT